MPDRRGIIVKSHNRVTWTIHYFFQLVENGVIESPYFQYENDTFSFRIGKDIQTLYKLSVDKQYSKSKFNVRVGVQGLHEGERKMPFCRLDKDGGVVLDVPDYEINDLQNISADITFYFEIYVGACDNTRDGNESKAETSLTYSEPSNGVGKLQKDLKELLLSGKDSDVTIKVKCREFPAHRLILGMRSPPFSAMFQHDTAEKKTGIVVIDDLDPDNFMDFLTYVYTGRTELSSDNVLYLYIAADKYEVTQLKSECLEFMKNSLSVDKFSDVMAFSLLHSKQELTDIVTHYLSKNVDEIVLRDDCKDFLKENAMVAVELLIKALKAK